MPSWCDRVLWHSLPDQAGRLSVLQYHPQESRSAPAAGASPRVGGNGGVCTYRALDHALISSDHTAVSCGFQLALPCRVDWDMLRQAGLASTASAVATPAPASGANSAAAPLPVAEPVGSAAAAAAAAAPADVAATGAATVDNAPLLVVPASRSSSSSVSSPNAHAVASPPAILVVRLLSVKVLCASPTAGAAGVPPPCAAEHSPAVHSRTLSGGIGIGAGPDPSVHLQPPAQVQSHSQAHAHVQPYAQSSRPLLPAEIMEHAPEPKYVRILFPAPYENGGLVPSKQVSFASSAAGALSAGSSSSPRIAGAHAPHAHPVHSASSSAAPSPRLPPTAASASASAGDALPGGPPPPLSHSLTPPPVFEGAAADGMEGAIPLPFGALTTKAEFRCLAFDDAPLFAQLAGATASASAAAPPASFFSAAAAGSATAAYACAAAAASPSAGAVATRAGLGAPPAYVPPPPAPYHLLLKMHASDGLSGQCGVALPRVHFNNGDTLEFLEGLSRDGLPLLHPATRAPVRVHFVLALSVAPAPAQLTQAHAARSALQLLKNGKIN